MVRWEVCGRSILYLGMGLVGKGGFLFYITAHTSILLKNTRTLWKTNVDFLVNKNNLSSKNISGF